jgi:hypothetical protein
MCTEAGTLATTVELDFFFNCWYLEIPSDNRIRHVPRCVNLDLRNTILGYRFHIPHRNFGTFPVEGFMKYVPQMGSGAMIYILSKIR